MRGRPITDPESEAILAELDREIEAATYRALMKLRELDRSRGELPEPTDGAPPAPGQ